MQTLKCFLISFSVAVFLFGCDSSDKTPTNKIEVIVTAPILDEPSILNASGLNPVRKYELEDGHGFYMQESPDASIEFRTSPDRINLSLRTFPESEFKEKNDMAKNIVSKLAAVITGTDGKLIDGALSGEVKTGKTVINGLPVNVSVAENSLLVTINK
ncbi:hypothetical protein [Aeromonas sp. A35_P]|uniref:hypothetical protein n=1 Tax=Aeromonas sp. A35_P TaxID=1983805 RepID=UPI00114026C3|nr:hypothetical protein [Aeromonas sp. A35_P]